MKWGQARAFIDWVLTQETDDHIEYPYCRSRKSGYGVLHGKLVHRIVCEEAHGPCPPGMETAHSCKVKACINPRHLSWKTRGGNLADKIRDDTHSRGERQWMAKLTEEKVRAIKHRYAQGGISQRALAAEYGVCQTHIGDILRGERWGWLSSSA